MSDQHTPKSEYGRVGQNGKGKELGVFWLLCVSAFVIPPFFSVANAMFEFQIVGLTLVYTHSIRILRILLDFLFRFHMALPSYLTLATLAFWLRLH